MFYFSSELYREKFLESYLENRVKVIPRWEQLENELNFDFLSDLYLYREIEKRGFFARLKGCKVNWADCHGYALRKMVEKESGKWERVKKNSLKS